MGPKNADDTLLARLNALRPTSVTLNNSRAPSNDSRTAATTAQQSHDQSVLAGTPHNDEDDALLDDLLNDAGFQNEWDLDREDERDVKKLAADAQAALKLIPDQRPQRSNNNNESDPTDFAKLLEGTSGHDSVSEDQEAQEIIAKMLAELELERHNGEDVGTQESQAKDSATAHDHDTEDLPFLELPSTPSEAPKTTAIEETEDDALAARFSGLSLPGPPSFSPSKKPAKIVKSNLPKYTDDDIDSWCIICNDDATVKCTGCDGDLYCRPCWKEGHTGPEVGFEEKQHRWTKYEAKKSPS